MGAGIAAALITAAGTAYAVSEQQKAQKRAQAGQEQAMGATADLGEVPDPAFYQPVDFEQMQNGQILDNYYSLRNNKALVGATNKFITADAIKRAKELIPQYSQSMAQMGANTGSLLGGHLPFEDMLDIVNDRAAMTGATGISGTGGGATLKDLGMSRLDAMKTGTGMLGDMVSIAERISPRASYLNPKEMMMSPMDRIKLEMEQSILQQQSDQNANNLRAAASPSAIAQSQLLIGGGLNAGTQDAGNANTAAAIGGIASSLVGAGNEWGQKQGYWGTPTQTPGGGYYSERGMYRANPTAYDSVNVGGSRGWEPVSQAEYFGDWSA